jgi:hypothetical protein
MTSFPESPHKLALLLFKELQDVRIIDSQCICGKVPSEWDIKELEDALSSSYLLLSMDESNRQVVFNYPPLFINKFQEILNLGEYYKKAPEHFYLVPENYSFPDEKAPSIVVNYKTALRLIELLIQIADYAVPTNSPDTLVFIGRNKIELNIHYDALQLNSLEGLKCIERFDADFINSQIHSEQKKKIIVTTITEMFKGQSKVDLGVLFTKFAEFYESVCHSYDLYIADFSYEKVKAEVVKEKLDSIIKINKVFSDIQNQLLAVPLAIVLIGGQLDKTGEFWIKNLLIWCGAFVFTVFMDLLIRNQRNSLKAVKDEVNQHRQQLNSKYLHVADKFCDDFIQIYKRITHQKILLWIVDGVVALAFAGITIIALWFNDWLMNLFEPFNLP